MTMENLVILLAVAVIVTLAGIYVVKSKMRGRKCIGCPGACTGCSCQCSADCDGFRE